MSPSPNANQNLTQIQQMCHTAIQDINAWRQTILNNSLIQSQAQAAIVAFVAVETAALQAQQSLNNAMFDQYKAQLTVATTQLSTLQATLQAWVGVTQAVAQAIVFVGQIVLLAAAV